LKSSGFSDSEITGILDVIVGILFLGNIQFKENQDAEHRASIKNTEMVSKAATYLKVQEENLSKCLLKKTVKYPGQTIEIEHSRVEALSVHHSLLKSVYSRLFEQIVAKVNEGLSVPRRETDQEVR